MTDLYRLLRVAWPFIGCFGFIFSISQAFEVTSGDIAAAASAVGSQLSAVRVTWLVSAIVLLFFTVTNWRHRGIPITVIQTKATLYLKTADGSDALFTHEQVLRANREDVSGYQRTIWSDGKVPRNRISCNIHGCESSKQSIYLEGDERRWSLIHRFPPLKRNLLMLGLNTVKRTESIVFLDSFVRDQESLEIQIPDRYRHRRVTLRVIFHHDREPAIDDCEGWLISASGAVTRPLNQVPGQGGTGCGVELTERRLRPGDRVKIIWKYPAP